MRAVVRSVREFKAKAGRLPTNEDLYQLSGYYFGQPPPSPGAPELHVPPGGWIIWYWRGEWPEYYTSWDDHYSLEEGLSLWGFCRPLTFMPVAAVLCFVFSFVFRTEPLFSVRQLTG
jgi:hypothetical protein